MLLALLLAAGLSWRIDAGMSARLVADEALVLESLARNAGRQLASGFSLRLREVQVMAASPTLWSDGLGANRVREVFKRSQAVHPHSAWIGVTDARGVVMAATGGLLEGQDVSSRPWFEHGRKADYFGDLHAAKLLAKYLPSGVDGDPQRFVDFASPIVRDGELKGVVAIHGSWDWTHETLEMLLPPGQKGQTVELFVFDRAGQPIYARGSSLAAHLAQGQTVPKLPSAGGIVQWRDGVQALTAAVPVQWPSGMADLGWTIVARQPVEQALGPAREASRMVLLLGGVAALLAALAGTWLAGRLMAPLRRLADAAHAIEDHPHDQAWQPVGGPTEVGKLSQALGRMTQRLQQANAELEQRVQERTLALEQANQQLAEMAHHDPLTRVLNRRGFDDRVTIALAAARRRGLPLSLITVDADHFKRINDRFGHEAGDQVLQALADTLRHRLREVDILARMGGEEFVAVLTDAAGLDACRVARDLVDRVAALDLPGVGRVTISCGVSEIQVGAPDALRVAMARADAALYDVKARGRNGWKLAADPLATVVG